MPGIAEIAQLNQCLDVAPIGSLPVGRRDDGGCLRCPRRISPECLEDLVLQLAHCLSAIGVAPQLGHCVRETLGSTPQCR
jgi:hypothetical protein